MKKLLIVPILAMFMACGNDKCVDFTPTTVDAAMEKLDSNTFTKTEMALIAQYMMQYSIIMPDQELEGNPFAAAIREKAFAAGFIECSDFCEVLDYQREMLEKKGMSEEEFYKKFEGSMKQFDEMDAKFKEADEMLKR